MSDSTTPPAPKAPFLSNRLYDQLKWLAQYGLPALGAFYWALAAIWGFLFGEEVIGTITACDVLLGVLLGISTRSYNASDARYDGTLAPNTDPATAASHSLVFNAPLSELTSKGEIVLKVTGP